MTPERFAVFASVAFVASLLGAVAYFSVGGPAALWTVVFVVAAGAGYALAYVDDRLPEAAGVGRDHSGPESDGYTYE